jgi:hypothetical protein
MYNSNSSFITGQAIGKPGARFPYARYENDPRCGINVLNLPADVSTLKRPAHYGRSQLKKILEAKEQIEIHVGEIRRTEGSTSVKVTDAVVKPNNETESNANPVENPVSNLSNNMSNLTPPSALNQVQTSAPSQPTSESVTTETDEFKRMQERKLRELPEDDINVQLQGVIEKLRLVCHRKIENWKHDILKKGVSTLYPEVRKVDLKLNTNLGPYTEDQLETVVKFIMKEFPKEKDEYKWYVLFPEALTRMTKNILSISIEQANCMMENSMLTRDETHEEFNVKSAKRAKKHQAPTIPRGNVPEGMKRPCYKLETSDEANILNPSYMLTDREIMIGQNLLRKQFPTMNGLMSTTLGPIGQFDVMRGDFVQILHNGSLHWVCVSNVTRRSSSVNLSDSMFYGSIATSIKEQIASMLHEVDNDEIEILVQPVQQQTNSTDCGVFALAFATAVCFGYEVSHCSFDVVKMRSHLWKCMKEGHMEMFPCKRVRPTDQPKVVRVKIYCDCRQIHNKAKDSMARCDTCKKWYHRQCQRIPKDVFAKRGAKWTCSSCK